MALDHIKLKLKYTKKACSPDNDREQDWDAALNGPKQCRRISYIIFGMLLNWRAGRSIPCYHGRIIPLSFDDSLPFCLCNYGYGGDQCDVSLTTNPDESLIFILNIAKEYKVPRMFDDTRVDYYYVKLGDWWKRSWTGRKMKLHKNGDENPWHWAKFEVEQPEDAA